MRVQLLEARSEGPGKPEASKRKKWLACSRNTRPFRSRFFGSFFTVRSSVLVVAHVFESAE